MRLRLVFAIVVAVLAAPAPASEPGQPLTSEDWVVVLPGLVVQEVLPWRSTCQDSDLMCTGSTEMPWTDHTGADGSVYYVDYEVAPLCDEITGGFRCFRVELRRWPPSGQPEVVAYINERVGVPANALDKVGPIAWRVDPLNGSILLRWDGYCQDASDATVCTYTNGLQVTRISGLPTTFEILQSYTPTTGPLSFRVPYMPEGFQHADYFDTYYGDLATVGDWGQARPLQCGYPATPPSVGDYFATEDNLPIPAPGTGRYYVTAVTHQGQRRFGRKSIGGVLTGRDPAVLPACE